MKRSLKNILPVLVVFFMINLACNFPTQDTTTPEQVASPLPPQLEGEGESFFEQDLSTGTVTIVLTEHDVTNILAAQMQGQDNPPLRNPTVLLRDGQVEVSGQSQTGPFLSDVRLVMVIIINQDGFPEFQVVSADIGPVAAPAQVRDQIAAVANDNLRRSLAPEMQGYRAEKVDIDGGRMTITAVPE
jgi:hypothetical protein